MSQHNQQGSFLQRIGQTVRYAVLLLGGTLLIMTLSYHVTLWILPEPTPARPAPAPLAEEEMLQGFSRDLTNLMREYLDRASREGSPPTPEFQRWSRDYFAPRASELRRRIQASPAASHALSALLAAADRMVAMARQPEQTNLRQLATDDVFDAAAAVEDRIAAAENRD